MNPNTRKLVLAIHIAVSVGWIGAVVAYLALVVNAMVVQDDQILRASWAMFELIGWYVIVPLALAALASGIGIAIGTTWGLFRHHWVAVSLILTVLSTAVLLQHMATVTSIANMAAGATIAEARDILRPALRGELFHAGVGLVILLGISTLNVYKPRGLTAYGRSRSAATINSPPRGASIAEAVPVSSTPTPLWVRALWFHAAGLLVLLAIMHAAGGLRLHG